MRDFALTAALVNLLGDEGDAAGLPPEPLIGWYTSRHRRNLRVSSSLLGAVVSEVVRMRVSSCDPATRPIRPRPSYRTLNQHLKRNRKFVDSPLERDGFELSVPPDLRKGSLRCG